MIEKLVDSVVQYCSRDETRLLLERKIVEPVVRYLTERFQFGLKLFQAIALLVAVQTIVLLWICVRLLRL